MSSYAAAITAREGAGPMSKLSCKTLVGVGPMPGKTSTSRLKGQMSSLEPESLGLLPTTYARNDPLGLT